MYPQGSGDRKTLQFFWDHPPEKDLTDSLEERPQQNSVCFPITTRQTSQIASFHMQVHFRESLPLRFSAQLAEEQTELFTNWLWQGQGNHQCLKQKGRGVFIISFH